MMRIGRLLKIIVNPTSVNKYLPDSANPAYITPSLVAHLDKTGLQ